MVLEVITALPYGEFILAAMIIIGSVIIAKIFMVVFSRAVLHVTSKTKTILDELILHAIRKPIYIGIILAGVFIAVGFMSYFAAYMNTVRLGFTIIWILLSAYTAMRFIGAFFTWYAKEVSQKTQTKMDDTLLPMIKKIINVFVIAIALMIILRAFGIEITPLVAGLGIGGLAIALALQDTLSGLFAGAFIISDKVMHVGDFVELDNGVKGYVDEIGWRSTRIKTLPNNYVIVPNATLANSIITDYNSPHQEMGVIISCGVGYNEDLDRVEKITKEVGKSVLQNVPGGKKDYEPLVRFNEFGDSNINFSVILRVEKFVDKYLVTHEFIKALKKRYDQEGIEISWPVRKVVMEKDKKEE
ncbi:mechanosensitive ion channel family protein [Candidatus Aenigmatarchaeota archaeon]